MPEPYVMAIELGVTNVKAGLVDRAGRLVFFEKRSLPSDEQGSVANCLVEACREVLRQAGLTTKDLVAVGCCMPGCVDPSTGVLVASERQSWEGVDAREPLRRSFDRPVTVEGAGNATALYAYTFGPTKGQDHILGVKIGTTLSGGFVVNGNLLRGAGQVALELGHLQLFPTGRPCTCGRLGCWQSHCGGAALRAIITDYQSAGHQLPALPEEVAELAAASHETAQSIFDEQGALLGAGISLLLDVLNPKSVVLAGGVAQAWALFKKSLLKVARRDALGRNAEAAILCAPEPDRAALLGVAAAAVRDQGNIAFFIDDGDKAP